MNEDYVDGPKSSGDGPITFATKELRCQFSLSRAQLLRGYLTMTENMHEVVLKVQYIHTQTIQYLAIDTTKLFLILAFWHDVSYLVKIGTTWVTEGNH